MFRQCPLREQFCAAAEHGNHGVIFRQHDHILPKRTVELIPAFLVAHPDLIAVAMRHFAVRRFDLLFCGRIRPGFAENALAFPHAAVQVELAKLGCVLQRERKPPTAFFHALRAGFPLEALNAKRLKQARPQIVHKRLPRAPREYGGEHIRIERVIFKPRARFKFGEGLQEHLCPVFIKH